MLKNIYKLILLIIIFISIVFIVQHLKKDNIKESIIKEMSSQSEKKYNISENTRRCVSNGHMSCDSEKIPNSYKLLYEMNFDCSKCIIDMQEIYNFYILLSNIREIEFCLITTTKSCGYIKFHLDKSLKIYDLWVVQQKARNNDTKLYLLDSLNNIVMAGNILKYPFLKDSYIRKFKNEKIM